MGTWCPQELQIEPYPFVMLRNIYPLWTNNNFRDVIPRYFWSQKKNSGPENLGDFPSFSPTAMEQWVPWREIWGLLLSQGLDWPLHGGRTDFPEVAANVKCCEAFGKRFGIFCWLWSFFVFVEKVWWTLVKMDEHGNVCFNCFFPDRSEGDV